MKTCTQCQKELPLDDFYRQAKGKEGRQSKCKACCRIYTDNWNARNAERLRMYYRRKALTDRYGPDAPETFAALMQSQRGLCAVCGKGETQVGRGGLALRLAVDHDHATGAIRGLLCRNCNQVLGAMGDTIEGVMRYVRYLANPPALSLPAAEPKGKSWSRDWPECRECGTTTGRYGARGYCHNCHMRKVRAGTLD